MRPIIVESYQDEVVDRRTRQIRVVEDVTATAEAWHGRARLTDLGAGSSLAYGICRAEEAAERFGVTAESTLRIRVREVVEHDHRWFKTDDRYESGESIGRRETVMERHAFDTVSGPIESVPVRLAWTFAVAVAFDSVHGDPGERLLSYFRCAGLGGIDPRFFFDGFGYLKMEDLAVKRGEFPPGGEPADMLKEISRGKFATKACVELSGICPVLAPKGMPAQEVLERMQKEGPEISVSVAYDRDDRVAAKWGIWTGAVEQRTVWHLPTE